MSILESGMETNARPASEPAKPAKAAKGKRGRPKKAVEGEGEATPRGHNSVEGSQLKAFVERIERLEEERKSIVDDVKDVYAEAKGNGYDTKILRKVISLRKIDRDKREEDEATLDLYLSAIGMT